VEFSEPREIIDAFASALNAKDPGGIGALFSEDAVFVSVTGAVMRGRNEIIDGHAAAFAGPLADSTFRFDSITELPVTTDVTVLQVHGVSERPPDAPTTTRAAITTVFQLVVRQGSEGWLAVAASNVPETRLPGPSSD
jgi:uncharacterized protein (TIGR02246 family)